MKKTLLAVLLYIPLLSFAQKLKKNEVDPFTRQVVKQTSWKTLRHKSAHTSYFSVRKIDDRVFLDFKAIMGPGGTYFSIPRGAYFMIKLQNDSIITLCNLTPAYASDGQGAIGFYGSAATGISVTYGLDEKEVAMLLKNPATQFRFCTSIGAYTFDLKKGGAERLQKSLALVQ
jgi:hypothetical protein